MNKVELLKKIGGLESVKKAQFVAKTLQFIEPHIDAFTGRQFADMDVYDEGQKQACEEMAFELASKLYDVIPAMYRGMILAAMD